MDSNESGRLLPTTNHTRYQSIGPIEPEEEPSPIQHKIGAIALAVMASLLLSGVFVYGLTVSDEQQPAFNNGTHAFAPTVIFISLDGTVNQDLEFHITPVLSEMADNGVRAEYMTPSFPPITFPNHWSLVTGLYPEAHGVVGNYFYDAHLNDSFYYKSPDKSWDSKWWGGEPIWITAVRQNKKSGVIMWPGCSTEFNGLRPSYSVAYSDYVSFDDKVDQVFDWFDLPLEDRPQFIGLYVPEIDQSGHAYGPYANETLTALHMADQSIGRLLEGLRERNLTDVVNVIVVSDHGMSTSDRSRLIYYDDVLTKEELDLIWTIEAYPTLGIRPHLHLDQDKAVETLYQAFRRLHNSLETPHFEVYKKQDFPDRFHFRDNVRIPPLLVLPDAGWNLVTHKDYHGGGAPYQPRGVHGYDNLSPDSRAIFVAQGPHFPKGKTIAPFWNIELYSVMSRILHLTPASNNNTLNGILELAE
ncbi:nucleotide pyrophosphatase [Mucor ambiguus]|uniref:Nucleotide pyrophosphatase n=1 Tax=Mucor ambiguus TaxID=91626 RepID=A0A0C9MZK9_9FUNG|nr:nucleotide pyrophosphatase [Mucor ambiguus]